MYLKLDNFILLVLPLFYSSTWCGSVSLSEDTRNMIEYYKDKHINHEMLRNDLDFMSTYFSLYHKCSNEGYSCPKLSFCNNQRSMPVSTIQYRPTQ